MAKRKKQDSDSPHTEGKEQPKSAKKRKDNDPGNPFPTHTRPKEEECRAARDSLALLHGEPENPNLDKAQETERPILDSLVRTILSQNTTDTNSNRTFAQLKDSFGDWDAVRTAPSAKVEAAIKLGGLAVVKTERIKEILNSVKEEKGECSLEHLRELPDAEIKEQLLQYKGVGPKTAACVLMFSLGRFEFPVDTHVWRIAKNLGWVPGKSTREETYEHLNTRIPDEIKYDLHVLLVEHGKRCQRCAKNGKPRKESHGPCPLANLASAADAHKKLSAKKAAEGAAELKEEDLVKAEQEDEESEELGVKQEESDRDSKHGVKAESLEVKVKQEKG